MIGKRYSGLLDYAGGEGAHHGLVSKAIFHIGTVNSEEKEILIWLRANPGSHSVEAIAAGVEMDIAFVHGRLRHLKRAEILSRKIDKETKTQKYGLSDYAMNSLTDSTVSNRQILGSYLSGSWQYGRLRLFDFLVMLVMQILIARWVGISGFGNVVVISLISSVIGQIATLGLVPALGVFLPTYVDDVDRPFFKGAYRYVQRLVIPFAFLISGLSIAVIMMLPMSSELKEAYFWGFTIIPIWVIWDIAQQPCISLKKWTWAWGPDYFVAPVVWVISLLLLHYMFKVDTMEGVMFCKMLAALMPMLVQILFSEILVRRQTGNVKAEYEARAWWQKAVLLLGINLINVARGSVMVLVANFMLGSRVAGQFGAAKSALAPTQIIRTMFKSAAAPDIPAFYKAGRKMHLHYLAHCMTGGVTIGTVLILPLAIIFGKPFLELYGITENSAYLVLLGIMSTRVVMAMFGYPNAILSLTQFQKHSLAISTISVCTMLLLVSILVLPVMSNTELGMYMLVLAYFINQGIYMFMSWWVLLRILVLSTLASVLFLPPRARIFERLFRRKHALISDEIAEARSLGQQVPLVGLIGRHDPVAASQLDDP